GGGGTAGIPQAIIDAGKADGGLTTIALPHSWCNYGDMLKNFTAKFGIKINELNPDGGSKDEVEAIKANKDNKGPAAPDVIDVGLAFGPQAKTDGVIQAYKVASWDSIPATAKDADGFWYGDYYGVLAFEVNTAKVANVSLKGNPPITVVVPKSGRFGGMYVQAISAYAPHPNAAKLWMEYLYSDEGQNTWLKGYCNPIRYDDLVKKNTIDATAKAAL